MSGPIIRSRSSRTYAKKFSAAFGGDAASKKTAGTQRVTIDFRQRSQPAPR